MIEVIKDSGKEYLIISATIPMAEIENAVGVCRCNYKVNELITKHTDKLNQEILNFIHEIKII